MDRASLSETIIAELGAVFSGELRRVGRALVTSDLDGIEQQLQDLSRRVLGPVVEQAVAAIAAAESSAPPVCAGCQQPMRLVEPARKRDLQGLVGEHTLQRAYYCCDDCYVGTAPLDARLGLGRGMLSPGLGRVAARTGIEDAFESAAAVLRETPRIDVADEGIGAVAEAEPRPAMAAAEAGQAPSPDAGEAPPGALLVEVDGVQVPIERSWNEMKVRVVAPLGPATEIDPEHARERRPSEPHGLRPARRLPGEPSGARAGPRDDRPLPDQFGFGFGRVDPEDRVGGRIRQGLELAADLMPPALQVRLDQARLLLAGNLDRPEGLDPRAASEFARADGPEVPDPIRLAARRDKVPSAIELEDVHGDHVPASAPAPAHGQCGHEPEPHQERVDESDRRTSSA